MMQESGRRSEARGRLLPDLLPFAVERAEEEAEVALRTQVPDGEPDAGGYRSPDTLVCDSKAVAKTARLLARLWLEPSSKFHRSDALVYSVRRAMRFFEYRAQQPDGSTHGLPTGDMGSAPHAAFAVEAFHELLPVWARVDHPARREVEMAVRRCMVRAGVALRSKGVFTHNHRWIACAALACINDIAPDARLVARIDDYLSDGIDQDEDGFWSEYSPVYAMLSNICYTRMADLLDRPELLEPVWRNLDTLPFLRHSNGEVACEFTFRQDRGAVQRPGHLLEWARRTGRGELVQMVLDVVDQALAGGGGQAADRVTAMDLLDIADGIDSAGPPAPIPESYRRTMSSGQIVRIRRGTFSATIMGRAINPDVPFISERTNENLLAVRNGSAIIDGVRIGFKYYGQKYIAVPENGLVERDGSWSHSFHFTSWVDGPVLWREIEQYPELHVETTIREVDGGVELNIDASGCEGVILQVEMAVRPAGELRSPARVAALSGGQRHLLDTGPVRIVNGGDALEIDGDLVVEHAFPPSGAFTNQPASATLLVTPRTPYSGTLVFRGGSRG